MTTPSTGSGRTQDLHNAARSTLQSAAGPVTYYRLDAIEKAGLVQLNKLPFSIRILLENMLRKVDGYLVHEDDVATVAAWNPKNPPKKEVPFMPGRVLLQDFTGVPVVVDLAAMRDAMVRLGGDPKRINPIVPADLVIDHSVQVDFFGSGDALKRNADLEFERNQERYALLRWAQKAFQNLRVVPPDTGIVHQVNLEYLASVIMTQDSVAFPDTVVGTDSHTTMINGLSVLGWGVGGIEAEAVLLGQPYYMVLPEVIGFKLTGQLPEGSTATDLVLTVTQMLRRKGVVEKFVEFYGPGLSRLPLTDRATIANMAPEYGATCGFFPIDDETLAYMRGTGRDAAQIDLVERYAKEQGLFRTDATPNPEYTDTLELDMGTVEPSLAGPSRPQDRVVLRDVKASFAAELDQTFKKPAPVAGSAATSPGRAAAVAERSGVRISIDGEDVTLDNGSVVIAAITSCTNTSNPSVMIGAGLLARKAIEKGLTSKPWVKTSLAPGSRVVADYLAGSGLLPYLEQLGFHIVGYGCTTCIGNSGPLPEAVANAVQEHDLVAAAVLSGNRNFEGRVHPLVKANYLASPVLVVAYALAGTMSLDLTTEPLGQTRNGDPVYLRDIWPSQAEVRAVMGSALNPEVYRRRYAEAFEGDEPWQGMSIPEGEMYAWDASSSYVQEAPYFEHIAEGVKPLANITGAKVLAYLGDSVTTDHISPAGSIPVQAPAGQFLIENGVQPVDFNTFGARRGNHLVMVRGTFGNIRLKNKLVPDAEGDWTVHLPDGEKLRIYDASMKYQAEDIPLIIISGKEYGAGSSRDWAAKGPKLLGVKAVIAESYERIHRSNLVGMGVLPLQFNEGESAASLGISGFETFDIQGISDDMKPGAELTVKAVNRNGETVTFQARSRIDTPVEIDYYKQGGVLQAVLNKMRAS